MPGQENSSPTQTNPAQSQPQGVSPVQPTPVGLSPIIEPSSNSGQEGGTSEPQQVLSPTSPETPPPPK